MENKKSINPMEGLEPRLLGHVGVDAGIVWIGDPCYILHRDQPFREIGKDWEDFCDRLMKGERKETSSMSFNYDLGHEGLGVCTSTRWGDGVYSVIGFFEPGTTRPMFVIVDFSGRFDSSIEE